MLSARTVICSSGYLAYRRMRRHSYITYILQNRYVSLICWVSHPNSGLRDAENPGTRSRG